MLQVVKFVAYALLTTQTLRFLLRLYSKRKYNYLKRYNYDGPRSSALRLGNLLDFQSVLNSVNSDTVVHHYSKTLYNWSQMYGSIYGYYEVFTPIIVISDADLVHELFLTSKHEHLNRRTYPLAKRSHEHDAYLFLNNGARWQRVRKCLEKILINQKNITSCATYQQNTFNLLLGKTTHKKIDIYQRVRSLCANTMFESIFGMKLRDFEEEGKCSDVALIQNLAENFDIAFKKFQKPTLLRFLGLVFRDLDWLFYAVFKIQTKLFSMLKLNDFVDPLYWFDKNYISKFYTQFRDSDDQKFNFFKLFLNMTPNRLTTDEALSNIMLVFFAGFETTSASLAFVCHILATNKVECDKLLGECKNVDDLSMDSISQLTYLDRFIKEALRMYPIASSMISRECADCDIRIGANEEYLLPKGVTIAVDVLSIHYNQKLWGEHDVFDFYPDRFLDSNIHPAAWLPFGIGKRRCLGMKLAVYQIKLFVISLLQNFTIEPIDTANSTAATNLFNSIETSEILFNCPLNGLNVNLTPK